MQRRAAGKVRPVRVLPAFSAAAISLRRLGRRGLRCGLVLPSLSGTVLLGAASAGHYHPARMSYAKAAILSTSRQSSKRF